MKWSNWYYRGVPDIGDYIWVEGEYKADKAKWSHKGIVTDVNFSTKEVHTTPDFPGSGPAKRWRKLIEGNEDRNEITRELFTV